MLMLRVMLVTKSLKDFSTITKIAKGYSMRADYWKSQARKYCDFCKCWIADNKPSVEFHEKGRRHQDNVAKKLKFITKKSRREERESVKTDLILKQIESAALEAYRKDVQNNSDLSSIAINDTIQQNNLVISPSNSRKLWNEAKNDEGRSYYYNVLTNESVWHTPKEGYVSIAEQTQQMRECITPQLKINDRKRIIDVKVMQEEMKREAEEARAAASREKMKERRVSPEPIPTISGPILEPGKTDPYGKWQKVESSSTPIDLQLPRQEYEEYYEVPAATETEPPPREFKEKTVESLGDGKATFKKRKFVSGAKKNTRQRLDD
ncbi:hypothetical protein Trydic_g18495 [Trypoxylus dichotomus]